MRQQDVQQLACLPFFAEVSDEDLAELCALSPPVSFGEGEVVFRQGEPVDTAMLVVDGLLEARVESEGSARVLGFIQPGEVVGESALFDPESRRSATVVTRAPTRMLLISRQMLASAPRHPAIVALEHHLVRTLARRLRATNHAIETVWAEMAHRKEGA